MKRLLRLLVACLLLASVACGDGAANDDNGGNDQPAVRQRNVSFETEDGLTLTGRLFGRGRVGVALAHMYSAGAETWYDAAKEVAGAGYLVLAFNFRGYNESEGEQAPSKTTNDLEAAAAFLKESGALDVAYVGASMGGTASIIAADTQDPLAIVAISAPLRFRGLDAVFVATRVQRPVLLLAAQDDDPAFESLQELVRALPNPDQRVFEGSAHGTDLLTDRPEAIDQIVTFLKRYAPPDGANPTQEP